MVKTIDETLFPATIMCKGGKIADKNRIIRQIKEILAENKHEVSEYFDAPASTGNKTKLTKSITDLFLILYANLGTIAAATNYLPISSSCVVQAKKSHPRFKAACEDAELQFQGSLIEEATRRGRDGVDEDIFFKDQKIGVKTNYSDRLMEKLLDGFGGERFKKAQESAGAGGTTINILLSDGTILGENSNGSDKPTIQLQTEGLPTTGVEVHGEKITGSEEEQVSD